MTPKEKAEELFYKMLSTDKLDDYSFVGSKVAKQCALICVDEIIESTKTSTYNGKEDSDGWYIDTYWQEVKQEIEKL
jgi:hypothetical protein